MGMSRKEAGGWKQCRRQDMPSRGEAGERLLRPVRQVKRGCAVTEDRGLRIW